MKISFTQIIQYSKNIRLLLAFMSIASIVQSQSTFEKIYATDEYDITNSIETTADHGYILVGQSGAAWDTCASDMILVKCDADGNMEWANSYATEFCDQGWDVKQTPDHGNIVTGTIIDTSVQSCFILMKTDSLGNIIWQNKYSSNDHDEATTLYEMNDGSFILGGYRYNFDAFGYDMTMTRFDADGNVIWSKVYYTGGAEYGQVQITDNGDGTFYMAGVITQLNTFPIDQDFFILRMDEDGNVLSARSYGNAGIDEKGWGIIKINSNRYWLIGTGGPDLHTDALVLQIDSSGNVIWSKVYSDGTYAADESSVTSFYYIPEYGLFVCGFDAFYDPYTFIIDMGDAFVFQVTDDGEVAWWRDFGNPEANYWEIFTRMKVADDGNLLLAGSRTTYGNYDEGENWDMYVTKTTADGKDGCETDMTVSVENFDVEVSDVEVSDSSITLTVTPANLEASPTATSTTLCSGLPTISESPASQNDVELYPNPADDGVMVKNHSSLPAKEIRFYDLLGREILRSELTNQSVNTSNLPENFYLFKIFSANDVLLKTGKITIVH